jgi:hypothetical protein
MQCVLMYSQFKIMPIFFLKQSPFSVWSIAAMSMLKPTKKRKVDHECHVFKDQWTQKSFFVQNQDKAVCLVRTGDQSSKSVTLSGTTMRVIKKNMTEVLRNAL